MVGALVVVVAAVVAITANQGEAKNPTMEEGGKSRENDPSAVSERKYDRSENTIRAFARAFGDEVNPAKRLAMVRHSTEIEGRLDRNPEELMTARVKELSVYGKRSGNPPHTAFPAKLEDGSDRVLAVVETADGLKIDWDAFARHGTASWKDMLSGRIDQGDMRVFLKREEFHVKPFEDKTRWRSFRLSSPDTGERMFGYVEAGTVRRSNRRAGIRGRRV